MRSSIFDFLNTALRGMFDKCASCAEAWERVVCALACSPKQNSFVSHGVHFDARGHINNVTYQLYIHTSLANEIWNSCAVSKSKANAVPQNVVCNYR